MLSRSNGSLLDLWQQFLGSPSSAGRTEPASSVRVFSFDGFNNDNDGGIFSDPEHSGSGDDITQPLVLAAESTSQATNLESIQQYHARCKEEACARSNAAEVLAADTPNRARYVIICFCNRTSLTSVVPSEKDLEELWLECNALVTSGESKMGMAMVSTAIIYALCGLLLRSNGQEWKPQLRVLVLLQFLHSRGGLETFIAENVIAESEEHLKHLTEVPACREEALKVIQLTQPAEVAPPEEFLDAADQWGKAFPQREESLDFHAIRTEDACTGAAAAQILAADTPGEAKRLIVGFCNGTNTAGMRMTPKDEELEDLWSKCSALVAGSDSKMAKAMVSTAMIYALCDQLSCSPLGALALLQFLRCRGDLERFIVEMVVDESSELLGSLSRNDGPFQEVALQLLQPKVPQEAVSPSSPGPSFSVSSPRSPLQDTSCGDIDASFFGLDEDAFCISERLQVLQSDDISPMPDGI